VKSKRHVKIVIPCSNEGEWLRVTVESILEHTRYPSYEIVVSANGDRLTDFSFIEKPGIRERVRLKESTEVLGVGNGRNAGVFPGDAMYYVFLDSHSLVEEKDWLERAVESLEEHPAASMIQPEVQNFIYDGELKPGVPFDRSRVKDTSREYSIRWSWPYDKPWQVRECQTVRRSATPYEAMSGAGMAIFTLAKTFHRLGKFDSEVMGWFHETLDYCVRAGLLGHPMMVDPRVQVRHRTKVEMEEVKYPRLYMHMFQGILRTTYKYLSPRRRDLAEVLLRRHGIDAEVNQALELVRRGNWLEERLRHLRSRVHDDDWLFSRFEVYEEPFLG
jgi:GT2 family glycosyltransferase